MVGSAKCLASLMIIMKMNDVEGREGIVVVYDSMTGEYLGCMGRETWERLLKQQDDSVPPNQVSHG
jgi:DTW domain-containing protein YfiP